MSITLQVSMIKYVNTRRTQYSAKNVLAVLEKLGWAYNEKRGLMIVRAQKTFKDREEAVKGKRDLEAHFRVVHKNMVYRWESLGD